MSGGIVRVSKPERYAVIHHDMLRDSRLSFGARGLLSYLLSRPDNWTVQVGDLIEQSPAGRDAVYGMLKELETYGYLKRERRQGQGGKIEWEMTVYELPSTALPYTDKPEAGEPYTDKPNHKKERSEELTNNEVTNEEIRADFLPPWLDPKVWARWVAHRMEIKHPITPQQAVGQFRKLEQFRARGMPPEQVIEESIAHGWQGLFELKRQVNGQTTTPQPRANYGGRQPVTRDFSKYPARTG